MALVSPVDPTPERVSACPVHFIWDGRGPGRAWVRAGFLGLLTGGALASAGSLLRSDATATVALGLSGLAGAAWLVGQLVSLRIARRSPLR